MSRGSLEVENVIFLLRSALNSIKLAIESLGSPVMAVSEMARQNLTSQQSMAIEKSFLRRATALEAQLAFTRNRFSLANSLESLRLVERDIGYVRDNYFKSEQVFDYYVDLLHTRSENGVGPLLRGCDQIAIESLKRGLGPLGLDIPTVVCYLDRGEGASILRSGIYLWDGETNPAAIIKVVRSALPLPKLTAVLHEIGHQAAHITDWNKELETLLYEAIISLGGSRGLARLWASWVPEITADFWALHQSNFASVVGLSEVVAGSTKRVFRINLGDPHPMAYLRVMLGLTACKVGLGNGPWEDFARAWQLRYQIQDANTESIRIILETMPLLPEISRTISNTKMNAFSGKSLNEILPWALASPLVVKSFLNNDHSNFSVSTNRLVEQPLVVLTCFRYIQMFGGRSHEWIVENMRNWLTSLALVGDKRDDK
jgi:hypothetical protein